MARAPFLVLLALGPAAMLLAACGGSSEEGAGAPPSSGTTITITETEFAIDPATPTINEAGPVTIRVVNDGDVAHALELEGNGIEEQKTGEIQPGGSAELTVDLSEGSYTIYCPIDGHRGKGMEGAVGVGGAAATPGDGSDDPDSDRSGGYGSY
jgi:plastocyanin